MFSIRFPFLRIASIAIALIGLMDSSLAQQPHPAVARVECAEANGGSFGTGTLIAANDDSGLLITNWHVVRTAKRITVKFPNGFQSEARVLRTDKDWDLAALLIWKPPVQPILLAEQMPRKGDRLSIAGYGSGRYRLAHGRCTQYVAPGENFPYEMVELSAQAREGDSGGPILNADGELAGVLFGAARGTTSGSHADRVRRFLVGLIPANPVDTPNRDSKDIEAPPTQFADDRPPAFDGVESSSTTETPRTAPKRAGLATIETPDKPDPLGSQNLGSQGRSSKNLESSVAQDGGPTSSYENFEKPPVERPPPVETMVQNSPQASRSQWHTPYSTPQTPIRQQPVPIRELVTSTPRSPAVDADDEGDSWTIPDALGQSPLEQIKSFLAIVGALALAKIFLSRSPARK